MPFNVIVRTNPTDEKQLKKQIFFSPVTSAAIHGAAWLSMVTRFSKFGGKQTYFQL